MISVDSVICYSCDPDHLRTGYGAAINRLLPQLSRSARPLHYSELASMTQQDDCYLFLAKDDTKVDIAESVVGMALIFFVQRPEGWLGQIHSVVVDKLYRGQHIGSMLLKVLLERAQRRAKYECREIKVELTSNPNNADRATAIKMYEKYGFKLVAQSVDAEGTNLYRLAVAP